MEFKLFFVIVLLLIIFVVFSYKKEQEKMFAQTAPIIIQPIELIPEVIPEKPKEIKTYEDALAVSKTSGKKIFLYFGANWCNPCKNMKKITFESNDVKNTLSNYIVFIVDIDENKNLSAKYRVSSVPTYLIIDGNENINKKSSGFKPEVEFLFWLNHKRILNNIRQM